MQKEFITTYNRLPHGRRIIENAYGIPTSRINENVNKYVPPVASHNFLMTLDEEKNSYCHPTFVDANSWNGNLVAGEWSKEKGTLPIFSAGWGSTNPVNYLASLRKLQRLFYESWEGGVAVEVHSQKCFSGEGHDTTIKNFRGRKKTFAFIL